MEKYLGWRFLAGVVVGLFLVGCGDGDNPPAKIEATPNTNSEFAIRGYKKVDGKLQRVTYGIEPRAAAPEVTATKAKSLTPPGAKPQAYERCLDGCNDEPATKYISGSPVEGQTDEMSREELLRDITQTCRAAPSLVGAEEYNASRLGQATLPWNEQRSWFTLSVRGETCDDLLEQQELLLCVADRLTNIADAVNTVTFEGDLLSLVFPPQELKDKFIVRDLAMTTLAHIALLDMEKPDGWHDLDPSLLVAKNCSEAYGIAYRDYANPARQGIYYVSGETEAQRGYTEVLGVSLNGTEYLFHDHMGHRDLEGFRADLAFRAKVKGHVLSASASMLRELVDTSVQADLAGAETRRAQAGDDRSGLASMWGVSDEKIGPYDSLRHAMRVLFGRLELEKISTTDDPFPLQYFPYDPWKIFAYRAKWDPECGGQAAKSGKNAQDLIFGMGPGFSARWHDISPSSAQQSLAMSTLGQIGLVLPLAALDDLPAVREAVRKQLYLHNAGILNVPVAMLTDQQKANIDAVLAGIEDSALRFGAERSFDAYRMLTDSEADIASLPSTALGGLTYLSSSETAAEVTALGGKVIERGLPRRELFNDPMGVLGAAQAASQCASINVGFDALALFQDPFLLGAGIGYRLGYLRDTVHDAGLQPGDEGQTLESLDGAMASVRSWAARGVVLHYQDTYHHPLHIRINGLVPADLGVTETAQMKKKIVIVWGESWQAECAAGIRTRCPDASEWGVITPYAISASDFGMTDGMRGTSLLYTFRNTAQPTTPDSLSKLRYYLVTPTDPKGGQAGRILAAVAPAVLGATHVAGISDYQRELGNSVFGTGDQDKPTRRSCSNEATAGLPRGYCIDGMQRDQFVPLANELNSDGPGEESWRHYLTVAEQAATHADELGRQMIEKGEQREIRREGGQEQLGTLCGAYVPVDSLHADENGFAGSELDNKINQCVRPETYDLVFLTTDKFAPSIEIDGHSSPADIAAANATDQKIRAQYCQPSQEATRPGFCEKDPTKNQFITHAGLGLPSYVPQKDPPICENVLNAAHGFSGNENITVSSDALRAAANEEWIDPAVIGGGLNSLRYAAGVPDALEDGPNNVLDPLGNYYWSVKQNGKFWIATKAMMEQQHQTTLKQLANTYPACLEVPVADVVSAELCSNDADAIKDGYDDCSSSCLGDARLLERAFGSEHNDDQHMYDVEAALWYAAALAGGMPSQMMKVRVPVRNMAADNDLPSGSVPAIQLAELYAAGQFTADAAGATNTTYHLYSDNSGHPETSVDEQNAMGAVFEPPLQYWQKRAGDGVEHSFFEPSWHRTLYQDAVAGYSRKRHLLSAPVAVAASFDLAFPHGFLPDAPQGVIPRERLKDWLLPFADKIKSSPNECLQNGHNLLRSITTSGEQASADFQKDAQYAPVRYPRNLCTPAGGGPVLFEDDFGQLHARIYFRAEDRKESDVDDDLDRSVPYTGWTTLGDMQIAAPDATEVPVWEYIDTSDYSHVELFPKPFNASVAKGGLFSLNSSWGEEYSHYGWIPTDPSIQSECMGGTSTMSAACLRLGGLGLAGTGSKIATTVRVTGNDDIGSDRYRVEEMVTRGILAGRRLRPTVCSPGSRAEIFTNRYPATSCTAGAAVARGLALACLAGRTPRFEMADIPPQIGDIDSLRRYNGWVTSTERTLATAFNGIAFKNIPKAAVERFRAQDITSELGSGQSGANLYALSNSLEALNRAWHTIGSGFAALHAAVGTARIQLESVDIQSQARELALARESIELSRQTALADLDQTVGLLKVAASALPSSCSVGAMGGFEGCAWSPEGGAVATIDAYAANRRLSITEKAVRATEELQGKIKQNDMMEEQNSKSSVLDSFQQAARHSLDSIDEGVSGVHVAANDVISNINSIQQTAAQGEFELGKMMGSDFVTVGDQAVPQHVNTVLNREYNILKIRYEAALKQAKRAAYVARLAIEQKLGVRFNDLKESVGPLPPPSGWIDDLCSLQGINYAELRCVGGSDPLTGGCLQYSTNEGDMAAPTLNDSSSPEIKNFANQYVGDYIARLKELVEFYNIAFPFKEADDVAVLSLRDNLLSPDVACTGQSPNLLYHSDELKVGGITTAQLASHNGWRTHSCDKSGCLEVLAGNLLRNTDNEVTPPDGYGGVSWLRYKTGTGVPDPAASTTDPSPAASIYQSVQLRAKRAYVMSWWDMARNQDGSPLASGTPPNYEATVYDENWVPLAISSFNATVPGSAGTTWSSRHFVEFTCPKDGDYHVVFRASDIGSDASIAIANVQLEEPAKNVDTAGAYVHTESRIERINPSCAGKSQNDLLGGFTRRCESGGGKATSCYYELNSNIVIDTEGHNDGFGGLVGQVSVGNANLRHVDLALNVVGTGVLDCEKVGQSSCYGSSFVEYDLEHSAFNSSIQNQRDQTTCFNFGSAKVRSGKALAAERVISMPVSSADSQLLNAPSFTKTELAGRPLSGVYRLRIKDNPALVFDRIEDIQLVLHYRYWSGIAPTAGK